MFGDLAYKNSKLYQYTLRHYIKIIDYCYILLLHLFVLNFFFIMILRSNKDKIVSAVDL